MSTARSRSHTYQQSKPTTDTDPSKTKSAAVNDNSNIVNIATDLIRKGKFSQAIQRMTAPLADPNTTSMVRMKLLRRMCVC